MSSARPRRRQAEYSESEREESEYETEEEEEEEERPRSRKRVKEPEDEYEEDAEEEDEEEDGKANRYSEEDEEAEVRKVNQKKGYVVRNEKDHSQIVMLCCGECRQRRTVVVVGKGKGLSRMRRSLLREKLLLIVVWPWFMTVTKINNFLKPFTVPFHNFFFYNADCN